MQTTSVKIGSSDSSDDFLHQTNTAEELDEAGFLKKSKFMMTFGFGDTVSHFVDCCAVFFLVIAVPVN